MPTASKSTVCRPGLSWAGGSPVLKPFADADDLWAQGIDFAVIQTRMYTQSVWAARQCKRRGIPALVIDHSTGYMLHGGLAGALGKAYEHAACGSIRRCGFPFYGVSGDVCRWLETFGIQAAGRLPNAVDPAELERLAHADNAVDWRRRLNVPAGGRLVAFVGGSSRRRARCGWLRPCRAFRAVRWPWRAPAPRRPLWPRWAAVSMRWGRCRMSRSSSC